jgi:NAD(P)-dependent dehydrogenase (short-subunit alcohol dehydrogenase family)
MSAREDGIPAHERGVAVVTGGTRGIGKAIAERLRGDGWQVVTLGRTGGDVACDVADPEAVARAFDEIEERWGHVACLVNNAGERRDGLAVRMTHEQFAGVVATNLTGAFNCTQRVLGPMLSARWGRIVNVSSAVALRANPGQANYAAAKAGLLALTRTVAREMGRKGVTCNAVTPGVIATDMTADGVADRLVELVPAGRVGQPEEVAASVAFLCSDDAAYVNGAVLAIDGGLAA